jgi:hypothetical protein
VLVREWSLLGGGERLPTIQERLRENYRAVQKRKVPSKPIQLKQANAKARHRGGALSARPSRCPKVRCATPPRSA